MSSKRRGRLLAFDPGTNTGWAAFSTSGRLKAAGLIEFEDCYPRCMIHDFPNLEGVKNVIIEKPRIYDRKLWKGDPNDLISVALIGGFCAGVEFRDMYTTIGGYREIEYIYPQDWKGGRPKDVDNKYTLTLLDHEETIILSKLKLPKTKLHNVIDAVGIGLWGVGRR